MESSLKDSTKTTQPQGVGGSDLRAVQGGLCYQQGGSRSVDALLAASPVTLSACNCLSHRGSKQAVCK